MKYQLVDTAHLFLTCFNTLIRTIENEKIKLLGYNYTNALSPRHTFQFAGDTVLAIATQEDSQALTNVFTKWCQWANFKICINKCRCFGSSQLNLDFI